MSKDTNGNGVTNKVQLAVIGKDVEYIKQSIDKLDKKVSDGYVPMPMFLAVDARLKKIEKGIAWFLGIVGLTIIGAMMRLILK